MEKIDKLELIKIFKFHYQDTFMRFFLKQAIEYKKIFVILISDTALTSWIYREHLNHNKKTENLMEKMDKTWRNLHKTSLKEIPK